jgi:hypothetical protein
MSCCLLTRCSGECKDAMMSYLGCLKKVKGVNEDECRQLAKSYLACRMDRYEDPGTRFGLSVLQPD